MPSPLNNTEEIELRDLTSPSNNGGTKFGNSNSFSSDSLMSLSTSASFPQSLVKLQEHPTMVSLQTSLTNAVVSLHETEGFLSDGTATQNPVSLKERVMQKLTLRPWGELSSVAKPTWNPSQALLNLK